MSVREVSARLESIKDKADAMEKETQEKEDAYVSMTEAFAAQKACMTVNRADAKA